MGGEKEEGMTKKVTLAAATAGHAEGGTILNAFDNALLAAGISKFGPSPYLSSRTTSMLAMLSLAISCLGTLGLKIHLRTRSAQHRTANALASALRNGAIE